MLALRSRWPGLAGDLSLGSAELVTFLAVVKTRRKSSLKVYFASQLKVWGWGSVLPGWGDKEMGA